MSIRKGDTIIAGGVDFDYIRALHDPDWSRAVSISAAQAVAGYTCPARGMLAGFFRSNVYNENAIEFRINGMSVARGFDNGTGAAWDGNVHVVVNKGDKATVTGRTAAQLNQFTVYFVPWKAQ